MGIKSFTLKELFIILSIAAVLIASVYFFQGCTKETTVIQQYQPSGYTVSISCAGDWSGTVNDSQYAVYGNKEISVPGDYVLARISRDGGGFIYVALFKGWGLIADESRQSGTIVIGDSLK
jgi:predicted nucleic acid-binding Zn ribbon protein